MNDSRTVIGFVAFGAGSLAAGWLGDRWSRRHMLAIFTRSSLLR